MSEADELGAMVDRLADRVRALEDNIEITQLAAQYGPAVDSGSGKAAALWTGTASSTLFRACGCCNSTRGPS